MNDDVSAATADPGSRKISAAQRLSWSVRRELWENRSLYVAPLVAAGVSLFGFLISAIGLPERRRAVLLLDPAQQRARIEMPYDMVAMMLLFAGFVVGVFYCLDALHGERRDRSILFWKSLPVSDFTTVLSKAAIPLAVLPLITFAVVMVTQVMMAVWTSVLLLTHGLPLTTSSQLPLVQSWLVLLYGLIVIALWHAPIYGWLLLVSAWARRATFLWALLPLSLGVVERVAFQTTWFPEFVKYRVFGGIAMAFAFQPRVGPGGNPIPSVDPPQLTPERFLSSPGLWLGLLVAAAFIVAAVRLRRSRGPL